MTTFEPGDDMRLRFAPSDEQLAAATLLLHHGYASVIVPIALPGKIEGVWQSDQRVEYPPGLFAVKAQDDATYRIARDEADHTAGNWLRHNRQTGTSAYCVIRDWDGITWAVFEGMYGPDTIAD